MGRPDFSSYPQGDTASLWARYAWVASELASAHAELGVALVSEAQAKVAAYTSAGQDVTSQAQRERVARNAAVGATSRIFELRAHLDALTEEKELLKAILAGRS